MSGFGYFLVYRDSPMDFYYQNDEATRALYTDKIIEGSVKFATEIKTDRKVKSRKSHPNNLLVYCTGLHATELTDSVFFTQ